MSLEKEIAKLTAAVEALTERLAANQAWGEQHLTTVVDLLTPPESVRETRVWVEVKDDPTTVVEDEPEEEIEAAPASEPEAEAPPAAAAPPPTLDQVKAAFRALAGRVGDVARNQTLTAELLRPAGGGEPPHLKNVPAESYAALIAAVEAAK